MDDNTQTSEELQFEYGMPKQEIDEPLYLPDKSSLPEKLTTKEIEVTEKDKDRRERRYFSAFKLIVGCLFFLAAIYIIETINSAILKGEPSSITDGVIEIIKTLLFTLSGYLFARKENGD